MESIMDSKDSKTTVVSVKVAHLRPRGFFDFSEWNASPNTEYIGRNMSCYVGGARGSRWANPFSAKKYGREECISKYREYILNSPALMSRLGELKGKELGCWCKPEPCHGDVLVELAESLVKAPL